MNCKKKKITHTHFDLRANSNLKTLFLEINILATRLSVGRNQETENVL